MPVHARPCPSMLVHARPPLPGPSRDFKVDVPALTLPALPVMPTSSVPDLALPTVFIDSAAPSYGFQRSLREKKNEKSRRFASFENKNIQQVQAPNPTIQKCSFVQIKKPLQDLKNVQFPYAPRHHPKYDYGMQRSSTPTIVLVHIICD